MTFWKEPPIIKIYEALGALADGRVEVSGDSAKVFSSSGKKFYEVRYDAANHAITAYDNGSYWKGYLGYPAISYLFAIGVLTYEPGKALEFKDIAWKDINTKYKNDFDKTIEHIFKEKSHEVRVGLENYAKETLAEIQALKLSHFGPKQAPPDGY